jgi:hypothetical protein
MTIGLLRISFESVVGNSEYGGAELSSGWRSILVGSFNEEEPESKELRERAEDKYWKVEVRSSSVVGRDWIGRFQYSGELPALI